MLTPPPMRRVMLQILTKDAPEAALILAEAGVFSPETDRVLEPLLPEWPGAHYRELYRAARARFDKIASYCVLGAPEVVPEPHDISEEDLGRTDEWLKGIWSRCSANQEALRRIREEQQRIGQLRKTLDIFAAAGIDLGLLVAPKRFLDIQVGTFAAANAGRLGEATALAGHMVTPLFQSDGLEYTVVSGPVGREHDIHAALLVAGWRALVIPIELRDRAETAQRTLQERFAKLQTDHAEQALRFEEDRKTFHKELVQAGQTLAMAEPYAEIDDALRARGDIAVISGWVPKRDANRLREHLTKRLHRPHVLSVRALAPEEKDQAPSLMYRSWLMRPFSDLVKNYGVPRYGEIDPTVLFALSFIGMFGMMFGDVGQGAVIVLFALLLRRRLKDYSVFVVAMGVSSMVFGWLYGSVFGYETVVHPVWMSPLSNPLLMLMLALYWGIGFMFVVMALTIYNQLSAGRYLPGFLDDKGVAGLCFYGGVLYAVHRRVVDGAFGASVLGALIPLAIILGYKWRRHQGPVGERLLVVLVEGFEVVEGDVANTLSFLRVAAFSLNHVALAMAIFMLADMMRSTGHWITVVIGNVFMLVLEGGVVAIQALRLEYYEGFARFYSGDGHEFRPLRLRFGGARS
ncbi:MAG: V-type ATP synthase subunit I [Acidiferrobacter sp.]